MDIFVGRVGNMKDIQTLGRMYRQICYILNSRQKRRLFIMFLAIFFGAVLEMLGVSSVLPFVQALSSPDKVMETTYAQILMQIFLITDEKAVVIALGIVIILAFLFKNIGLAISSYLLVKFKADLVKELRYQMMQCYMNRPYSFFVNSNTGSIIRGVTSDSGSVMSIIDYVFHILTEGLTTLLLGVFVLCADIYMALGVVAIGIVCFGVIVLLLKRKMSRLGLVARAVEGQSFSTLNQIINGIKDIMTRRKQRWFLQKFDDINEKARKASISSQFASLLPERIIETVCICGIIGVVLIRIASGVNNEDFMPVLAVFAVAAFRILPAISRITGHVNLLIFSRPGLEGAYENIKAARDYMESLKTVDISPAETFCEGMQFNRSIKIENISWRYQNTNVDVLLNLSMEIYKGEAVGIIGESGAGKSTLSDILLGLYKPQTGTIAVDNISIFDIPEIWSRMMGYVPQSVFLFDDTIRNNVAFGEKEIDDLAVWEVLEKASLKKVVESLPEGLDTVVGERGIKFSGGQRQRIAIARALYTNPDILILDEATSALDNETESEVIKAIESLQGSITMIIIAHRLTTIRNCDRIFKIEGGQAYQVDKSELEV